MKANWSPESSVKGGFDDNDVQDIHDNIHQDPADMHGTKIKCEMKLVFSLLIMLVSIVSHYTHYTLANAVITK